jgi:hypothetical protein
MLFGVEVYETSPSRLLKYAKDASEKLSGNVLYHIPSLLMKSKQSLISGDYAFLKGLEVGRITALKANLKVKLAMDKVSQSQLIKSLFLENRSV